MGKQVQSAAAKQRSAKVKEMRKQLQERLNPSEKKFKELKSKNKIQKQSKITPTTKSTTTSSSAPTSSILKTKKSTTAAATGIAKPQVILNEKQSSLLKQQITKNVIEKPFAVLEFKQSPSTKRTKRTTEQVELNPLLFNTSEKKKHEMQEDDDGDSDEMTNTTTTALQQQPQFNFASGGMVTSATAIHRDATSTVLAADTNPEAAPGLFFHSACSLKAGNQDKSGGNAKLKQYGWSGKFVDKAMECHCFQCDLRKVLPNAKDCKMFLLFDLDNWGLGQVTFENKSKVANWLKGQGDIFMWGFYGARFTAATELNNRSVTDVAQANSIVQSYHQKHHIHFSNCGYKKEAADLAILKLTELLLPRIHICIVSGDKVLKQSIEKYIATHSNLFTKTKFAVINPEETKKAGGNSGSSSSAAVFGSIQQFYEAL